MKNMKRSLPLNGILALSGILVAVLSACPGGSDSGSADGGSAGGTRNYEGPLGSSCSSDRDCGSGYRCDTNICTKECKQDKDCGTGGVCANIDGEGLCLQTCKSGNDCAQSSTCNAGATRLRGNPNICFPDRIGNGCKSDSYCPIGGRCEKPNGSEQGICIVSCKDDKSVCGEVATCEKDGRDSICKLSCKADRDCTGGATCQRDGFCGVSASSGAGGGGGSGGGGGGSGGGSGGGGGSSSGDNGDPCTSDAQCKGAKPLCAKTWPGGGYCTGACKSQADCTETGLCVTLQGSNSQDINVCAAACVTTNASSCRTGYACNKLEGEIGVCLPKK
jgi:hypothetical protein